MTPVSRGGIETSSDPPRPSGRSGTARPMSPPGSGDPNDFAGGMLNARPSRVGPNDHGAVVRTSIALRRRHRAALRAGQMEAEFTAGNVTDSSAATSPGRSSLVPPSCPKTDVLRGSKSMGPDFGAARWSDVIRLVTPVRAVGLEPTTSRVSGENSDQLSYARSICRVPPGATPGASCMGHRSAL